MILHIFVCGADMRNKFNLRKKSFWLFKYYVAGEFELLCLQILVQRHYYNVYQLCESYQTYYNFLSDYVIS